jgi:hypothetical protein
MVSSTRTARSYRCNVFDFVFFSVSKPNIHLRIRRCFQASLALFLNVPRGERCSRKSNALQTDWKMLTSAHRHHPYAWPEQTKSIYQTRHSREKVTRAEIPADQLTTLTPADAEYFSAEPQTGKRCFTAPKLV